MKKIHISIFTWMEWNCNFVWHIRLLLNTLLLARMAYIIFHGSLIFQISVCIVLHRNQILCQWIPSCRSLNFSCTFSLGFIFLWSLNSPHYSVEPQKIIKWWEKIPKKIRDQGFWIYPKSDLFWSLFILPSEVVIPFC